MTSVSQQGDKVLRLLAGFSVAFGTVPDEEVERARKRQNGGRIFQKVLRVPLTLQRGRLLRAEDGSFQVVWQTDLEEADLEGTQNYCVELLALYLRRMII